MNILHFIDLSAKVLIMCFCMLPLSVVSQQPQKLMPEVWHDLRVESGKANVLVVFEKQLSPTSFKHITGRLERSKAIHAALIQQKKSQQRLIDFLNSNQLPYRDYAIFNMIQLETNEEILLAISDFQEVAKIIRNDVVIQDVQPQQQSVTLRSTEWGLRDIGADQVWEELEVFGSGAVIGGQDTGYDWDHSAIRTQYRGHKEDTTIHDYNWHDAIHEFFEGGNPCGLSLKVPCDDHGHGTHTVGTMVGDDGAGNQIGVAPKAQWIGCRNMEQGIGRLSTYAECFEWFLAPYPVGSDFESGAIEAAPHVINNSWSCPPSEGCNSSNFFVLDSIVSLLRVSGIVVVVSAGNSGSDCHTVRTPAAMFESSFTVGATNINEDIAGFSSRGTVAIDGSNRMKPDISAPGVNVRSAYPGEQYRSSNGTSMAGPHVAGTIALMISANPLLDGEVDLIESILTQTARPKTSTQDCGAGAGTVPNNVYGHGIVDAYAAVQEAMKALNMRLLDFWGLASDKENVLYWATTQESYTEAFEVQKSIDGMLWTTFTEVEAQGFSNEKINYSVVDPDFFNITFYRLRLRDQFGDYEFSPVIKIERDVAPDFTIYPNPANETIQLQLGDVINWEGFTLELHDMLGRQWMNQIMSELEFDVQNLPKGVYFLSIKDNTGRKIAAQKLMIQD